MNILSDLGRNSLGSPLCGGAGAGVPEVEEAEELPGLGFRGLGFRVWSSGFRVKG